MSGFRDRLIFDAERGEYRDGAIRYLMIRPDSLMGMLQELPDCRRAEVLAALARSVATHGGKSAAGYVAAGGDLLASVVSTAPALGWGVWSVAHDDGLTLSVTNSPFAAGHGPSPVPVCHPIVGMLTAVARLVLGGEVLVVEDSCASVTGAASCRFSAVAVPP